MGVNKLVLIADDDPNALYLLRDAFRKAEVPCQLVEVTDGQQAIDYLSGKPPFNDRSQHPFPDLIVLDLQMPSVDGFGVLKWLRGHPDLDHLHVAVLSSSNRQIDQAEARRLGAHDFHVKPSDFTSWARLAHDLQIKWLEGATAPIILG